MIVRRPLLLVLPLLVLAAASASTAANARGYWGSAFGGPFGRGYGDPFGDRWDQPRLNSGPDSREGKVDADTFVSQGALAQLGHGKIAIVAAPGTTADASDEAAYEAALIDQLVKAGYDTASPDPAGGQVVELRIVRDTLVPEEQKRKPVSGEASIGVSNYGTSYGLAIGVDLSKPRKALLSTRLEAQIKDRASGATLWEGHASIDTRDGDDRWNEQAIATRLAAALFDGFPADAATQVAAR